MVHEPHTDIVVLGRRLTGDLDPSHIFGLRLAKAAEIYNQLTGHRQVVVSGGDVGKCGTTEAQAGTRYLVSKWSVPEADVFCEEQALDTVSNAVFCKLLMLESGCRKPMIISSCYHIPRVSYVFSHVLGPDFEPTYVSAATGLSPTDYFRHWRSESKKLLEAARFFDSLDTPPGEHGPLLDYLRSNGFVVEDTVQ